MRKPFALLILTASVVACGSSSSSDTPAAETGGSSATTTATQAGSSALAGASASGGGSAATGGAATSTGSATESGGATWTGGATASGGVTATGGAAAGGVTSTFTGPPLIKGINLSSAEWGSKLPGTFGKDYTYPTPAEVDRYTGLKMTVLRIPFSWERLQQTLNGELDATELGRLDEVVNYATEKGVKVILDVHNYARYNAEVIGTGTPTAANLADFWGKMATHYAANERIIYGLMNEPHDIAVESWLEAANGAIAAIRAAGVKNLILVPGTNWTGAHSWAGSNSKMIGVVDSENNYAFEVHQYLDSDSSGSHTTCVNEKIGTQRLTAFMKWLQTNGKRGFLGEFGAGLATNTLEQDQVCAAALDAMLSLMESRPDLWVGWAYWAGGPWWKEGTTFTITDKATPWQLTMLESHL